jgi:hypothetical protein
VCCLDHQDWEFPGDEHMGGGPDDKVYLIPFLYEFRMAINAEAANTSRPALLLTLPIPCNAQLVNAGYDLPAITPYLDWFHVMSYDYSGSWMSFTAAAAPIHPYTIPGIFTAESIDSCVNSMLFQGISPDKIVLGVIAFGYGWRINAPSTYKGPVWAKYGVDGDVRTAIQGPASKHSGIMYYSEFQALCWRRHITESPKSVYTLYGHSCGTAGSQFGDLYIDKQSGVVYGIYDRTWFTFENLVTVSMKLALLGMRGLRGTFVWATTQDDSSNDWSSSLQVEISTILGEMAPAPTDGSRNYHNMSALLPERPYLLVQLTLNPDAVSDAAVYNLKSSVAVATAIALPEASLHVVFTSFLNVSFTDDGVAIAYVECQVSSPNRLVNARFLNASLLASRINYALAITTGISPAVRGLAVSLSLDSEKHYSDLYDSGDDVSFLHAPELEVDDKTIPVVAIAGGVGGGVALLVILALIVVIRQRRTRLNNAAGTSGKSAGKPVQRPKPVPLRILLDAKGTPIPPTPMPSNRVKKSKLSTSKDGGALPSSGASPDGFKLSSRPGPLEQGDRQPKGNLNLNSGSPETTTQQTSIQQSKSPRTRSNSPRSPRSSKENHGITAL